MKNGSSGCTLLVVVDGFEELEAVTLLCTLRQASLCVKSVSLTSGLVSGKHGVWLMPDLTLADIDEWARAVPKHVVLPDGEQVLSKLEVDPRMHRLLRQVVEQGGQVVGGPEARRVVKVACESLSDGSGPLPIAMILREPGQSAQDFARSLIHRLEQAH